MVIVNRVTESKKKARKKQEKKQEKPVHLRYREPNEKSGLLPIVVET